MSMRCLLKHVLGNTVTLCFNMSSSFPFHLLQHCLSPQLFIGSWHFCLASVLYVKNPIYISWHQNLVDLDNTISSNALCTDATHRFYTARNSAVFDSEKFTGYLLKFTWKWRHIYKQVNSSLAEVLIHIFRYVKVIKSIKIFQSYDYHRCIFMNFFIWFTVYIMTHKTSRWMFDCFFEELISTNLHENYYLKNYFCHLTDIGVTVVDFMRAG